MIKRMCALNKFFILQIQDEKLSRHFASNLASGENEKILRRVNEFTSEMYSATATMKPPTTFLDDVFISVKTTKHYHNQRLPIILKTWFQLAKAQVMM